MLTYATRLIIRRPKDAPKDAPFKARWVESDGQMSKSFPLTPPLTRDDAVDLRWYLEKYHEFVGAGTQVEALRVEQKIDAWGQALFEALFNTVEGTNVYRNILEAEEQGRPVLLTLGTEEAEVLVQPWELMRDTRGPLAFRGVSIRRQLEGASAPCRLLVRRWRGWRSASRGRAAGGGGEAFSGAAGSGGLGQL